MMFWRKLADFLRELIRRQIEFYRHNHLTRVGKFFVFICFFIGVGAVNTGTNLLYLLFSLMVSLFVVNGSIALLMFKKLSVTGQLPDEIYAKQPCSLAITLTNGKRIISSYSLLVEDLEGVAAASSRDYCLEVKAGSQLARRGWRVFPRRGCYPFAGFKVTSDFPFGMLERIRTVRSHQDVIVFPHIRPVSGLFDNLCGAIPDRPSQRLGSGDEIFDVRPYQMTEDARHIHWKLSARRDELMIKDFEDATSKSLTIVFLAFLEAASFSSHQELFESAVEELASCVWHWLAHGYHLRLRMPGASTPGSVTLGSVTLESEGQQGLQAMMMALALVSPRPLQERAAWLSQCMVTTDTVLLAPRGLGLGGTWGIPCLEIG